MKNNELENFSLAVYSNKELEVFKKIAEEKKEKLIADWGVELGKILNEKGFDQYSKKGERKLDKFTKKHAELLSDTLLTLSMIDEELDKRENNSYQRRFLDTNSEPDYEDLSTEEFLAREREKIEETRKYLDR